MNLDPFFITFKLALINAIVLLFIALPVAYIFAFKKWRGKMILESFFMLPIVLPATVIGFYFLVFLGPNSTIGIFFSNYLNIELAFSFEGILLGSMIYCFPFMLSPIINGFRSIPVSIVESTVLLKKSRWSALFKVFIPMTKGAIISGILLTFAHTVGEFGIILMIGGKMAETTTASIAIYDEMNKMHFENAHFISFVLVGVSFLLILVLNIFSKTSRNIV